MRACAQLSWVAPAIHSDLSVRARQAVALVTFRAWRHAVGLDREELASPEDHLWQYATITPDSFGAWHEAHPLVRLGPGDPLPAPVRDAAAACGLGQDDVRRAVGALIEITYGGLFGSVESPWSLGELETLGRITDPFADGLSHRVATGPDGRPGRGRADDWTGPPQRSETGGAPAGGPRRPRCRPREASP